jgi:glycine/D-amino acid oxidase-like deaminating enzyme
MPTAEHTFHPDWQPRPYWWDAVPPKLADDPLPARVDVAVVGSGYCGLHAAREFARQGLSVAVIEARDPGYGASTRNHGMVSGGLKIPPGLDARLGPERADAIRRTAYESFGFLKELLRTENLDVDYAETGRFIGAHSPAWYERLKARRDELQSRYGYHVRMVPRSEQRSEVGSDFFHGGIVIRESGGMHPAKLHQAVWSLAEEAGARVYGGAEVLRIDGRPGRFVVRTVRGEVAADKVLVATNAYTGAFNGTMSPYLRRRLVPVTAYMVTTEELPPDLAKTLMPTNRMGADTKRSLYAYRLSPDGRRIIFAGRAKFRDIDERAATPILHRFMCQVWPELRDVRITHCWKGIVGFTFDKLPHLGEYEGIHYVAGCQGNGVALMSYLGHQAALKMTATAELPCGHDGVPFPTRPAYRGRPWFLPAVGAYYKSRDALDRMLIRT